MTNEERDLIAQFVQRVGGPAGGFGGSVPATSAVPPMDREADAWLAELFQRFPEARYRVTQYAFVQEHALAQAQATIQQLRSQLAQAQTQPAPSPWGAAARGAPPMQPGYAPVPFAQQGSGFFGSALRTAAGVAGGIFAADALMSLFGGHGGGFGGSGFGGGNTTIIENNYNSPWGAPQDTSVPDNSGNTDPGWTNAGTDPGLDNTTPDLDTDQGGFDDSNSI